MMIATTRFVNPWCPAFYTGSNSVSKEDCIATIKRAIEQGCNFFDTAELVSMACI
jgi:aryl-alcohol dehydrogenase-like predicted oxidoreductase